MATIISDADSERLMSAVEFLLTRTKALSQMILHAADVIENPQDHENRPKLAADLRTIAEVTISDVEKLQSPSDTEGERT